MRTLARIGKIIAAYLAASLAAGYVVAVPFVLLTALPARGLGAGAEVALFAALPAAAVIVYAESESYRTLRFYAGAGAMTGAVAPLGWSLLLISLSPAGWRFPTAEAVTAMAIAVALFTAGGLIGGMTYWAIAGRTAGITKPQRTDRPAPATSAE